MTSLFPFVILDRSSYSSTSILLVLNSKQSMKNNQNSSCSQRCLEYMEGLEEERRKIQVFHRELPLCFQLVSQAIETCKKELNFGGQLSECSSGGPVLEHFIPIKNTSHDQQKCTQQPTNKSDWLASVQLWNHTPDPPYKQDVAVNKNGSGGAFQPFKRDNCVGSKQPPPGSAISTAGTGGGKAPEDSRKPRRCWSAELHSRFLQALQQLGGAHVATPKQIRELMKVDGLTNDEVKSHLQKYRLHTRRPSSSSTQSNNIPQTPQFVVVGGMWMPPLQYASTVKTTSASGDAEAPMPAPPDGVYAPKAILPLWAHPPAAATGSSKRNRDFQSSDSGSGSEGRGCASSLATSSSTHTTIASHTF